jgi:hypothetical protein
LKLWIITLVHHVASISLMGALSQTIRYVKFFAVDTDVTILVGFPVKFICALDLTVHFYHY